MYGINFRKTEVSHMSAKVRASAIATVPVVYWRYWRAYLKVSIYLGATHNSKDPPKCDPETRETIILKGIS